MQWQEGVRGVVQWPFRVAWNLCVFGAALSLTIAWNSFVWSSVMAVVILFVWYPAGFLLPLSLAEGCIVPMWPREKGSGV
jgi:hypothetical protein